MTLFRSYKRRVWLNPFALLLGLRLLTGALPLAVAAEPSGGLR